MRVHIFIFSFLVFLALGLCFFLAARQRGVSVELSRNAAANREARALQANETLQRLAANPELKIIREDPHNRTVVLCVISRRIISALLPKSNPAIYDDKPLLRQLDNVDVEAVPYGSGELPALISEITTSQKENSSPALAGDFDQLLAALTKEKGQGFQIVFQ